jgi:TonB family protein
MILVALLLGAASAAAPAELSPSGKWQVEYAKSSCIVSRAFGEGDQRTLFGLKPAPYSETVPLLIIKQSAPGRSARGEAQVSLSGGFVPEFASYATVTSSGTRVTMINVPRATLDSLANGDSITIKADRWANVTLNPTGFDKVMKAVDACESDLLVSWGFDKAAQAAVATRPKGRLANAFKGDDYPENELMAGIGGTTGVRLRIEPDGKVSECAVIESSGSAGLDKQTCAVSKRRGRYTPAIGHDGKPLWSFTFERITWMVVDA